MIPLEQRGRALGAAASLLLHVSALLALEARSADPIVAGPAREVVLDVTWWTGDEGQGATQPVSGAPADASASSRVATSTDDPSPSDAPQVIVEASAAPPAKREAPKGDEPVTEDSPSSARVSERREAVPDRPEQAAERSLSVSTRRHAATGTVTAGSKPAVERRDAPAPRRKAERASTQASRDRRPSEPAPSVAAASLAERAASVRSAAGGRPGAPGPRGDAGSASELAAYLARVRARIASHQSAQGGEQGRVGVRFDVSADGSFTGLAAVSGNRGRLADAALRVVRRASPAPPIPTSLGQSRVSVHVTLVFE